MNTSPFSLEKDWDDVQRVLLHGIRRKHYTLQPGDIDDVVSDTLLWLMGPWASTLPEDPELAFKFAVHVGFKHASTIIKKLRHQQAREAPLLVQEPSKEDSMYEAEFEWNRTLDQTPDVSTIQSPVEDAYFESQETEWATQVIEEYYQDHLDRVVMGQDPETTEWAVWVRDLISGVSLREAAKRRNLSRPTITKRRGKGLTQLVKRAERELV